MNVTNEDFFDKSLFGKEFSLVSAKKYLQKYLV